MSILTFQEMWSQYLFGDKSPKVGDELLDENVIRDINSEKNNLNNTVQISASEFMTVGAGKFVNGVVLGITF